MNNKKFTLLFAGVLSLVILSSLVSAAITFTNVPTLNQNGSATIINLTSNSTEQIYSVIVNSLLQDGKTITFTPAYINQITANYPTTISIVPTIPSDFEFKLGQTYSTTLTITSSVSGTTTQTLSFGNTDYCRYGNVGSLEIRSINIDNTDGFGKDAEWYLLDEISADIEVKNKGNDKINDVTIVWGVYNKNTGEWIIDDEEKSFDLKVDKKETITVNFQIDPSDIDSSNYENYIFYAKAYSDDVGEDKQCVSNYKEIIINFDNDFVILDNIKFSPETAQCDQEITLTADAWNIGSDDQDDVYVIAYNNELNINKKIEIGSIDSLDKEKISFTFTVPEEVEEKTYSINFKVYDEDDEVFQNDEDDDADFNVLLKVEGNCILVPQADISAVLESGGQSGKEMIIKSTITNLGTKKATYTVSATGYSSWASLTSIDPAVVTLDAGQRADVIYKLNINKDVEGSQTFKIEIKTGDSEKETLRKDVSVSVQKSGFSLPGISGFAVSNDNWYLWGIGLLNVVLIVVIIIVAIRVAKS